MVDTIPGRALRFSDSHVDAESFANNTRQPAPDLARFHGTYPLVMTTPDGANSQRYQISVDHMIRAGYGHAIFNLFTMQRGDGSVRAEDGVTKTPDDFWAPDRFADVLDRGLKYYNRLFRLRSDVLSKVGTKEELATALEAGKIAAQLSVEGVHNWEIGDLDRMAQAGVRSIMGWNDYIPGNDRELWRPSKTSFTDGDTGLTPLGKDFVKQADKRGIILDGSHASEKTVLGMIDLVQDHPVIISHSGVYAVRAHKRNVTGTVLSALKETGGKIALPCSKTFVESLDGLLDQIDYLVEHDMGHMIMMGTDFGGMGVGSLAPGLEDSIVTPRNIDRGMEQRGHSLAQRDNVLFNTSIRFWLGNLPSAA